MTLFLLKAVLRPGKKYRNGKALQSYVTAMYKVQGTWGKSTLDFLNKC